MTGQSFSGLGMASGQGSVAQRLKAGPCSWLGTQKALVMEALSNMLPGLGGAAGEVPLGGIRLLTVYMQSWHG